MSERSWTPQQRFCFEDDGGTLMVSAAAGSGKTSVLVERIVQKVIHPEHPTDIDRLLVVTFTKAAAAEMRSRIAEALTAHAAEHPDDLHLQKQLLALPRANISTVHSFCINLVRENAFMLDLPPKFAIADEQQLLLLRKEALRDALDTCYAKGDPAFLELADMLSNGKNDRQLADSVECIYDFVQSHPYPEKWLERMETIYDDTLPVRETVWGRIVLEQLGMLAETAAKELRAALALCGGNAQWCGKYGPAIQEDLAFLNTLLEDVRGDASWDTCFGKILNFRAAKVTGVRKGEDEIRRQRMTAIRDHAMAQLKKLPSLYCGTEEQCREELRRTRRIVHALYEAVLTFSAQFAAKKSAKNLLDFNDAEHFALRLLTEPDETGNPRPTALARELSLQFDEIMVDEYQDTNAAQDALFSALSRNEENLFFVGDVKQSIYRFRKAMPQLFINRRKACHPYNTGQYPLTVSLGNNFRSRREITDTVNFLFRQLMSDQTGSIAYDRQEELVFSAEKIYPEHAGHETECVIVDQRELQGTGVGVRTAEARLIAERIRRCMVTPCVTENGAVRPARYGDFCLLLRSPKTQAPDFKQELERLGIPVHYETHRPILESAEVRLAMSLLRSIDNPGLDIPLAAVMLSPLFGFSPEDLSQIRLFRGGTCLYVSACAARRHPDADLAARCTAFLEWLDRYRMLAASLTVDALVRRLYEDTALPELMSARPGGAQRRRNLQTLHEVCQRFEQNGFRGLSAFVRHVDHLQEQTADLVLRTASPSQTVDAVRIMSIHGSKGLEFPIVFLAGLGGEFNNDDSSGDLLLHPTYGAAIKLRDPQTFNRSGTLPLRALSLVIRNDAREEDLRILYVALTRAREKLVIFASPRGDAVKYLSQAAAVLTDDDALPAPLVLGAGCMAHWILLALLRHPSAQELRGDLDCGLLPLPAETPWNIQWVGLPEEQKARTEEPTPAEADPLLVSTIRDHMAYTYPFAALSRIPAKMAASTVAHQAVASETAALSRPGFMSSSGLTPSERGIAMHSFMQFASYAAAAEDSRAEAERLVHQGFLTADQAASLDHKRLAAFFGGDLYDRIRRSTRCLREYHFTCRLPANRVDSSLSVGADEFVVAQGIADCLFEEDGRLIIVDYKTDRLSDPNRLAERYRPQLLLYREALSRAFNMPICQCLLYSFHLNRTVVVE